jgi:hypothetical protein
MRTTRNANMGGMAIAFFGAFRPRASVQVGRSERTLGVGGRNIAWTRRVNRQ